MNYKFSFLAVLLILVLHPAHGYFVDRFFNSVVSQISGLFYSPPEPVNEYDGIENPASRLLKTISETSVGILLESAKDLNSASPEIETYIRDVVFGLKISNPSGNLTKLVDLFRDTLHNIPKSTLNVDSGFLGAIPQSVAAFMSLFETFTEDQLTPLILVSRDFAENLAANYRPLDDLKNIPKTIIPLQDKLISGRDKIMVEAQKLVKLNDTSLNTISALASSIDEILNTNVITMQEIQNRILTVRLEWENYAEEVAEELEETILAKLAHLPKLVQEVTQKLKQIVSRMTAEMEESLNYNDESVNETLKFAEVLSGVAGTAMDLVLRQIQSALSAMHKSSGPKVSINLALLKNLLESDESTLYHSINRSENVLLSSFTSTKETLKSNIRMGSANSYACVNASLASAEVIAEGTIQSLLTCSTSVVEDAHNFVNEVLDETDDSLLELSDIAMRLNSCSTGYNSSAPADYSAMKLRPCLQNLFSSIRKSDALTRMGDVQSSIVSRIKTDQNIINTCVNQAFKDARDMVVKLEKNVQFCFEYQQL